MDGWKRVFVPLFFLSFFSDDDVVVIVVVSLETETKIQTEHRKCEDHRHLFSVAKKAYDEQMLTNHNANI